LALNVSTSVYAAATVYTGDAASLTTSGQLSPYFAYLINDNTNNTLGYVSKIGSAIQQDMAQTTIDYTGSNKPNFVVSGFRTLPSDAISREVRAGDNKIILTQGDIGGDLYSGLFQVNHVTGLVDCEAVSPSCTSIVGQRESSFSKFHTERNEVKFTGVNAVSVGTVNAGYSTLDLVSGGYTSKAGEAGGLLEASTKNTATVTVTAKSNEIYGSESTIDVLGKANIQGDVNGSVARLYADYGPITTRDALTLVNSFINNAPIENEYNSIGLKEGRSSALNGIEETITFTNNHVIASSNGINFKGSKNTVLGVVKGGDSLFNFSLGKAKVGSAATSMNAFYDYNSTNKATANFKSENNLSSNVVETSFNILSFDDENEVSGVLGGKTLFNISYDTIDSGKVTMFSSIDRNSVNSSDGNSSIWAETKADNNTVRSSYNQIHVKGKNSLGSVLGGSALVNLEHKDIKSGEVDITQYTYTDINTFSEHKADASVTVQSSFRNVLIESESNQIFLYSNSDTKLNDVIGGYAGIHLKYGDISANTVKWNDDTFTQKTNFNLDLDNLSLNAKSNLIEITGKSEISGDIKGGDIDFILTTGSFKNSPNSAPDNLISKPVVFQSSSDYKRDAETDDIDENNYINLNKVKALAKDNTIKIEGTHQFTNPNSVIYGGYLKYNEDNIFDFSDSAKGSTPIKPLTYDLYRGNVLEFNNTLPITVKEVGNFETYNFILNPEFENTSTALITANKIYLGSSSNNISDDLLAGEELRSTINVVGIQSGNTLAQGSELVLMKSSDPFIGKGQGSLSTSVVQQGASLLYDVETVVDYDNKKVIAKIITGDIRTTPKLGMLLQGNLSGLMLLGRGFDNLEFNEDNKRGLVPFAIFSGNHSRYNTGYGSDLKSDGGALTVGFSVSGDKSTWGAFLESGWDSYKLNAHFDEYSDLHGLGHNKYEGYGIFGRYIFGNEFYLDGTLRTGNLKTAFETADIRNIATHEAASYRVKGDYYGASLKGGYDWAWNNQNVVDLSAKYTWVNTDSQNLIIASDPVRFNALNSHRILLNAENNYLLNNELTILSGLGYEHEFDGVSKGTAYNYEIVDASVKGGTGVATVGLKYTPENFKNLSLDFKATGYFGKRQGGEGLLKVDYKF
jgi:hypothetical protein